MYTIESLTRENESYCLGHHIVQSDADKVNALVEAIETAHKMPHVAPLPGDTVHYTDKNGEYYGNAVILNLCKQEDGKAELCYCPFIPDVSVDDGHIRVNCSGGPFGYHEQEKLVYAGAGMRTFNIWGSCGPEENGLVEFQAPVNIWSYSEPNPRFGDYSTRNWDKFYVSYVAEPKNGSPYRFKVSSDGGGGRYAFRKETEYMAWLRTYRAIEFEGFCDGQTVVFCYRKQEKLVSKEMWDSLDLMTDTRLINASIIYVKVEYDDAAHIVREYRYDNKGTVEDVPYRVARREVEYNRLQRNIWACK